MNQEHSPANELAPAVLAAEVRPRSSRADVRNPLLAIPEVKAQWDALPLEAKAALVSMLNAMSKTFRARGEAAWRKHKPPVAAYWKASAVNCRHLALAGRAGLCRGRALLATAHGDPQRPALEQASVLVTAGTRPKGSQAS